MNTKIVQAFVLAAVVTLSFPNRSFCQNNDAPDYGSAEAGFIQFYDQSKLLIARLGGSGADQRGLGGLRLFKNGDPRASLAVTPQGEGELLLQDGNGRDKIFLGVNGNAGALWTRGRNNNFAVKVDYFNNDGNKGRLQIFDNGNTRADLYVNNYGDGVLELRGLPGNRLRAAIGAISTFGEFPPGTSRQANAGYVAAYGEDGNLTALLGPRMINAYDHLGGGHLTLRNREGRTTIQLNGQTGEIIGTTKSFAMVHPTAPAKQIVYAALEGPEAAAYVRGTAALVNGRAVIRLPEYFSIIISDNGLTAQLTPRSPTSRGLALMAISPQEIVVGELANGTGNYEFDYFVQGVRRGHENFQVLRDNE